MAQPPAQPRPDGWLAIRIHWMALALALFTPAIQPHGSQFIFAASTLTWLVSFIYCLCHNYDL